MRDLTFPLQDGAHPIAQAVFAIVPHILDAPEGSQFASGRWHNCREQGYWIAANRDSEPLDLVIAFFEHRNSDEICAVRFKGRPFPSGAVGVRDIPDSHPYRRSKYNTSASFSYNEPYQMAEWIAEEFHDYLAGASNA